ncbi:MAG: trehalose-phosphatase [Deltaproteobacteria bacterium]|nr:trehalose-phosphatase [Deltaproteobacteria bacterium]
MSEWRPREDMTDFHAPLRSAIRTRRRGRPLLLFLDYDGTLVEIAARPEQAWPTSELLGLLGRLAAQEDIKVMVVSGRPLKDLLELLPVSGLDFLGSHGGEAFIGGCLHPLPVFAADDQELSRWRNRLVAKLQPFQGWWFEDKPQGFALHYRQVPAEHADEFIEILGRWREQLRHEERFQFLAGKKVLEILPPGVSKGAAIKEILLLPGFFGVFPIYLGDDITDESAFHLLQGQGLTIKVGRPGTETAASHFLPDPEAVRHFLAFLAAPLEDS